MRKNREYELINKRKRAGSVATVNMVVNRQPMEFTRSVRSTKLDLFISMGSIIGLFFGASLLTLVETIHLWILHRS